jgi:peptidoglycan hydrolase-like protein with peptidoglycan-binding domain
MSTGFISTHLRRVTAVLTVLGALLFGVGTLAPAASAANVCGYTAAEPTLRYGSSGAAVRELQCQLNLSLSPANHTPLAVDGIFGSRTRTAVRTFQSCARITVDGVVGPQTWSHLEVWASSPYYVC